MAICASEFIYAYSFSETSLFYGESKERFLGLFRFVPFRSVCPLFRGFVDLLSYRIVSLRLSFLVLNAIYISVYYAYCVLRLFSVRESCMLGFC